MTIDLDRVRAETPGVAHVAHLNNAGGALRPQVVTDTVVAHLRREDEIGPYEAEVEAADRIEAVYGSVARLLGAHDDEIALVPSATVAWNAAFSAFSTFVPATASSSARAEYVSETSSPSSRLASGTGAELWVVVPDDECGQLDVDAPSELLATERVRLVAVTHVPTQGGLVNPADQIGELTRAAGVPFLLDACQSVGQLDIDVGRIGCDVLSATGRKFLRAPRGTGFLFVREDLLDRLEPAAADLWRGPWTAPDRYELRADARRFEYFEPLRGRSDRPGCGGRLRARLGPGRDRGPGPALAGELRRRLADLPGVTCTTRTRRCGIVTFSVEGQPAATVAAHLRGHDVNVCVSQAASARSTFRPEASSWCGRRSTITTMTRSSTGCWRPCVSSG